MHPPGLPSGPGIFSLTTSKIPSRPDRIYANIFLREPKHRFVHPPGLEPRTAGPKPAVISISPRVLLTLISYAK